MREVESQLAIIEEQLAAGTTRSAHAGRQRARLLRWGGLGLFLLGAAAGSWELAQTRAFSRPRAVSPAPPLAPTSVPAPTVVWDVQTTPAGARIVRVSDQVLLGTTPWHTQEPQGADDVAVSIELPGFVSERARLSHQKDAQWLLPLQPLPPLSAVSERPPKARPKGSGHVHGAVANDPPPEVATGTPTPTPMSTAPEASPPPPPAAAKPEPSPAPSPVKKPQRDEDIDVPALH